MTYEKLCAICSCQLHTENPRIHFCSKCFKKWNSEILNKSEWVRFLVNNEAHRRKYGSYENNGKRVYVSLVYLGDSDIGEFGGTYKIIHKFKEEGEE
jgi:predicted amidophosphoribosyltransferase